VIPAEPATVLYDADCGLCRWSAERLRRWDRGGRLRFAPLRSSEADDLLHELTPDARRSSWHLVAPDGRVTSGGRAIPGVLELLPGGRPLATLAERFPGVTDRAYRWTADHRRGIGRLLGRAACAVDPSPPRRGDRPAA
jgi:predicted DCC family thiol-disulfide oxidoreductase YuxK